MAVQDYEGDIGTRFSDVIFNAPVVPAYDPDNSFGEAPPQTSSKNAIAEIGWTIPYSQNQRMLSNAFVEYRPLDFLRFRVNGGVDLSNEAGYQFYPVFNDGGQTNIQNSLKNNGEKNTNWVMDYLMYFDKTFGNSEINALAGASRQLFDNRQNSAQVRDFVSEVENNQVISGSTDTKQIEVTGTRSQLALASYFGRINYNYDNRYLLSFNLRADGSSRFRGSRNRWGVFPSLAIGWNISEEPFFRISSVNMLKIRASWGQLGNQSVGSYYPALAPYSRLGVIFGPQAGQQSLRYGYSQTQLGNAGLRWETTSVINIGIDAGLLENKFSLAVDIFSKITDGILRTQVLPPSAGMTAPNVNYAQVSNKGIELELGYKNHLGNFEYGISTNLSLIRNSIKKLSSGVEEEEFTAPYGGRLINRVGSQVNSLYGYETSGVITSPDEAKLYKSMGQGNAKVGRLKYVDNDGDGMITLKDRVILGNYIPKATMGLTIYLSYKNVDLTGVMIAVVGRHQHSPMSFQNRMPNRSMSRKWYDNRYVPGEEPTGKYPAIIQSESYEEMTDLMVSNTSFGKLKLLTVGYTFDIKKLNARVFVSGENLLTITSKEFDGFDPENGNTYGHYTNWGGDYPTARILMTGLQLKF